MEIFNPFYRSKINVKIIDGLKHFRHIMATAVVASRRYECGVHVVLKTDTVCVDE